MMSVYQSFSEPDGISPVSPNPSGETVDLIRGLSAYGVANDLDIDAGLDTPHFNTPEDHFTLTDGVKAAVVDYTDPAFTHFTRGGARSVLYRLEHLSAVKGFSASVLLQRKLGIRLPERIDVFLSLDGKTWERAGQARNLIAGSDPGIVSVKAEFEKIYQASWVCFEISVACHVWAEHLSLYGSTLIPDGAVVPVEDGSRAERKALDVNAYTPYEALGGVQNIVLAYNCMPPEAKDEEALRISSYTVEEALPYLGYIDREGKLQDTFFDAALFLPYARFTYSANYKSASGWKYYIDNTFEDGKNVDAFDAAAAKIEKTLGKACRPKLFFSIFHTAPYYGEFPEKFGDLDGDGIDEDVTTLEGKLKVTKWMIDEQIRRFRAKERTNVELCGFYWFEEDIACDTAYEREVLDFVQGYVHGLGYKLIWIPYYQAPGYTEWKSYGFDAAAMQPNYAFQPNTPAERLYVNARLAKKYGMCYEMEINSADSHYDCDRYKEYLQAGVDEGFMYAIKMYYQSGRAFHTAFTSEDPFIRSVYDDTYLFAKEKLEKSIRLGE
ncbi:MAG: DUF4855 domain-containing protein [Oscillospiraceae bacterium]|nr:DUF4855 domain-containing protein [Oscillospiraceae bacterium]